jgi:C-methyltransferase C-terminal domain
VSGASYDDRCHSRRAAARATWSWSFPRIDAARELAGRLAGRGSGASLPNAYGAAAKGNTLLNTFGIGTETLDFVADRNTYKQGWFMPGVRVPIFGPERLVPVPDVRVA